MYKLFFLGTPTFALPALTHLANDSRFEVCAVITQPDKPSGRGNKLTPPPVKVTAQQLGIAVFQPSSLKQLRLGEDGQLFGDEQTNELCDYLNTNGPFDAAISVAYGKIIPKPLIDFPRMGIINIHPSLLPRWRGAAPIEHALFAGDEETGTSIMLVDEGLDTGPVFVQEKVTIANRDTFGTLHNTLAEHGAGLLLSSLEQICQGTCQAQAQSDSGATYANKWEAEDCQIDWTETAVVTERRIRTCAPNRGARTSFQDKLVKIFAATLVDVKTAAEPGTIIHIGKSELGVATGAGMLAIEELQLEGKKRLPARDIINGGFFSLGDSFS